MMSDQPPKGKFDWLIEPVEESAVEVPMPPGLTPVLRVVIEARARVVPTRGWGLILLVCAVAVITLLIMIAANTAHAANWTGWHSERDAPAWGQMEPGRTTTYVPWQKPDGTTGRCAVYQWRGEPQMRCE